MEHLWSGERAIARRLLVAALPELSAGPMLTALASAQTDEQQSAALAITEGENLDMVQLVALINQPVASGQVNPSSSRRPPCAHQVPKLWSDDHAWTGS